MTSITSLLVLETNVVIGGAGFFASIPDCRSCESPRTVHPECMPIPVPRGDHHYPQVNHTTGEQLCFSFMRSLPGQQHLGKCGTDFSFCNFLLYNRACSHILQYMILLITSEGYQHYNVDIIQVAQCHCTEISCK
jgi:hypothetical protein